MALTTAQRCELVSRNTAELLTHNELEALFDSGMPLHHYLGFEISGRVHLGTGLVAASKMRDFMQAGIHCNVLLADWHTWINDKLGGNPEVIHRIATGYFTEGMRAGLMCVGGDPDAVEFVVASDFYANHPDYWATVIGVGKHTTLARMQRSITILGRGEGDNVDFAKLMYPAMQAADIFALGIHLAHAGMDQRKAHVIARDVASQMPVNALRDNNGRVIKPLAVHHPLILGLSKPPVWPIPEPTQGYVLTAMKMSKSNPNSAVFIHDEPDVIRKKVFKAFCPPGEITFNPILDWIHHLVFGLGDTEFHVERAADNGGPITFADYSEVEAAFAAGSLHPMDAKSALADRLIDRLEPARRHFAEPEIHAMLEEIEALTA